MHRLGDGTKIEDINAARAEWFAKGQTKTTYCNKGEWDAFPTDDGVLVRTFPDGRKIRSGATRRNTTRGGSRCIIHNCVLVGTGIKIPNPWSGWNWHRHNELEQLIEDMDKKATANGA